MEKAITESCTIPFSDMNDSSCSDAALQSLQEEMELVGYVASHDLQAPLRIMLDAYTTLKEKRGTPTDPAEQEAMQTLEDEIIHLKTMLQGLQDYIRLETFSFKHISLDANQLVSEAIETLQPEIRKTGASVTCDPLPELAGHRGRLTRLFAHLIDNAIKFHCSELPKVHISAQSASDDMWTFCIEDNGTGIDEEQQEIIFRLFQRLHADTYAGYGIGLALARKIVTSHGGRLWVESKLGQGSRFFFTLPARK